MGLCLTMNDIAVDAGVITACQEGDREAFRRLYDAYQSQVYSTALYFMSGNSAFFFQAEDGIRDLTVTGVQRCALPISWLRRAARSAWTSWSASLSASKTSEACAGMIAVPWAQRIMKPSPISNRASPADTRSGAVSGDRKSVVEGRGGAGVWGGGRCRWE